MMMVMQPGLDDITKQKMLQARALCKEVRGGKCGWVEIDLIHQIPVDVSTELTYTSYLEVS